MTDIEMLPLPEGEAIGWTQAWGHDQMRAYARANVAHATAAKDAEIEALRAEVRHWKERGTVNLSELDSLREKADRAERLAEAGRRVTAAFRALGEATAWTRAAEQARHECEAAMLALDAELEQENDDA